MDETGIIARLRQILDKRRSAEDCGCRGCRQIKATRSILCERCGYKGTPATVECACYDWSCGGGESRGAGCFHGAIVCPVCDDGEGDVDAWNIIQEIREILDPAPVESTP